MPSNPHKNHYMNLGHTLMGVLYAYTNNCQKAEEYVQQAIKDASLTITDSTDLSNAYVYHKEQFLQTLHANGQIKEICYENTGDINDLKQAWTNYIAIIDFVENVRNGFAAKAAKQDLNNSVRIYYTKATSIAMKLYQLTKDKTYLNKAFQISDKGKSILLHEELLTLSLIHI